MIGAARTVARTILLVEEITPAPKTSSSVEHPPRPIRKVHHVSGWKVVLLWLLGWILRAWGRTLRLQVDATSYTLATQRDSPTVVVFWHNRLFFASRLLHQFRPHGKVVGLVSASRDGAALAKFLSFLGVPTVRGSSSRLGREAVHALVGELQAGRDVVVTPDGPRGPMYDMKPGALLTARRAHAPVLLVGIECRSCFVMPSWDRFRLPLPFARAIVRCERLEPAALGHGNEVLSLLRERLLMLNGDSS